MTFSKTCKALLIACAAFAGVANASQYGVLSYSIEDSKLVINTDIDVVTHACKPYAKQGRIYVDLNTDATRSGVWSNAAFDAMVSYKPLRVDLTSTCDAKYGLRASNIGFDSTNDPSGGRGVKMVRRNLVKTQFVNEEVRENVYGYPIEVFLIGDSHAAIYVAKDSGFSKEVNGTVALNSGSGQRTTSLNMVVPAGYFYKVSGVPTTNGMVLK